MRERRWLVMGVLALVCCGVVATTGHVAPKASAASTGTRWFHSPSFNIECEVSPGGKRGKYAYCQTAKPPASVTLRTSGHLKICHGGRCIGNGPEDSFKLGYGRSVTVGPFRCTSFRTRGMRCIVRQTGTGFFIAKQGVTRIS
jgi:hypothetical protein